MLLNLSVGGNILAAVPLDPSRWKDQQYVHHLCELLAQRNRMAIEALKLKPTYFIEVPSRMKKIAGCSSASQLLPGQMN